MIHMQPVESSQIHSVGFDAGRQTLAMQFRSGGPVYEYAGVTQEQYDAFLAAESKGKHFGAHIKGKFDFEKIAPPENQRAKP